MDVPPLVSWSIKQATVAAYILRIILDDGLVVVRACSVGRHRRQKFAQVLQRKGPAGMSAFCSVPKPGLFRIYLLTGFDRKTQHEENIRKLVRRDYKKPIGAKHFDRPVAEPTVFVSRTPDPCTRVVQLQKTL